MPFHYYSILLLQLGMMFRAPNAQAETCYYNEDLQEKSGNEVGSFDSSCSIRSGKLYLGEFFYSDSNLESIANITYTCSNNAGEIYQGSQTRYSATFSREAYVFTTEIEDILYYGLSCNITGCYDDPRDRPSIYRLPNTNCSLFLDKNECDVQNPTHNCHLDATCINNSSGTFSCECNQPFVGNGTYCEVSPMIESPIEGFTLSVNQFQSATLECSFSGIPAPRITWFKSQGGLNSTLVSSGSIYINISEPELNEDNYVLISSTLFVNETVEEDSGNYFCISGSISREIVLFIEVAANITKFPMSQTVRSPGTATFSCTAAGLPEPIITWTGPDGTELVSGMNNIAIDNTSTGDRDVNSTLTIMNTSPSNSGIYSCRANNNVVGRGDTSSVNVTLAVHMLPEVIFPSESFAITVDQFQSALFECSVTGFPAPQISWIRSEGGQNTTLMSSDPIEDGSYQLSNGVFLVNSTLVLNETMDGDSGSYLCVANNTPGSSSKTIALTVQVAANITEITKNQSVWSPETATFSCTAAGLPRPTITWTGPDGTELVSGMNNITLYNTSTGDRDINSTLTIMNTSPSSSGIYSCRANNNVVGRGDIISSVNVTLAIHLHDSDTKYYFIMITVIPVTILAMAVVAYLLYNHISENKELWWKQIHHGLYFGDDKVEEFVIPPSFYLQQGTCHQSTGDNASVLSILQDLNLTIRTKNQAEKMYQDEKEPDYIGNKTPPQIETPILKSDSNCSDLSETETDLIDTTNESEGTRKRVELTPSILSADNNSMLLGADDSTSACYMPEIHVKYNEPVVCQDSMGYITMDNSQRPEFFI